MPLERLFIMRRYLGIIFSKNSITKITTEAAYNAVDSIYKYIDRFHDLAIEEMHRCSIPASIKLAQGILESKYGKSELAVYANNHFGIKCNEDWRGNRYNKFSHEWTPKNKHMRMSCFRCYETVKENYIAHSNFLRHRTYYKSLFQLKSIDYRLWAKGLQKSGYATDPRYASKLIQLIEQYKLHKYDRWLDNYKQ